MLHILPCDTSKHFCINVRSCKGLKEQFFFITILIIEILSVLMNNPIYLFKPERISFVTEKNISCHRGDKMITKNNLHTILYMIYDI